LTEVARTGQLTDLRFRAGSRERAHASEAR
jgi:hypothetical protein